MVAQDHKILQAFKAMLNFFVSFVAGAACSGFTPNAKARYEDDKDGHPGPSQSLLELTHAASTTKSQDDP